MRYVLLGMVLILSLFSLRATSATTVAEHCIDTPEAQLLTLINDYRAQYGAKPLALDAELGAAADHHSVDMALTHNYAHTLSDGTTWSQNIVNHGYGLTGRGENIAWGYTTVQSVFDAWKASPSHNENMLYGGFGAIGIGLVIDPNEPNGYFWTNTFGPRVEDTPSPMCDGTVPTPANTPQATATPQATLTPQATATAKPCPNPKSSGKWCR